jgi:hypothetical protein
MGTPPGIYAPAVIESGTTPAYQRIESSLPRNLLQARAMGRIATPLRVTRGIEKHPHEPSSIARRSIDRFADEA